MDFKCFKCESEFGTAEETIKHLKTIHWLKHRGGDLYCIVNHNASNKCSKKYVDFNLLRNHVKQCLMLKLKSDQENVSIYIYR